MFLFSILIAIIRPKKLRNFAIFSTMVQLVSQRYSKILKKITFIFSMQPIFGLSLFFVCGSSPFLAITQNCPPPKKKGQQKHCRRLWACVSQRRRPVLIWKPYPLTDVFHLCPPSLA